MLPPVFTLGDSSLCSGGTAVSFAWSDHGVDGHFGGEVTIRYNPLDWHVRRFMPITPCREHFSRVFIRIRGGLPTEISYFGHSGI